MTRVLSVASECVPLIKTGGLADVAGALPGALAAQGVEMRTLVPGYRPVMQAVGRRRKVAEWDNLFGGFARVYRGALGDQVLYALDAPHLFDRDAGPYLDGHGRDWDDNAERFAALSSAAAMICAEGIEGWMPQVMHCHDWQSGWAPLYLRELGASDRVASLMTIHNIAFQGISPPEMISTLGLPHSEFTENGYEFYNNISALKAGLVYSDKLGTVSPTREEWWSESVGRSSH